MRELIAGEGGAVLVRARHVPAVALAVEGLAGVARTPSGLPVFPVEDLPDSIEVDRVRIVDAEVATREALVRWAGARGVQVVWDEPEPIPPPAGVRVVAVSAASTGSGKTALTRRVARTLQRAGLAVAVARHPIADLLGWGRFDVTVVRTPSELARPRPITEREELWPLVGAGIPVATGLDPEGVLDAAAREVGEGGMVVWDGGGAARPWVAAHLHLVALDLLRDPPELPDADVFVLTKADTAPEARTRDLEARVRAERPRARVLLADLAVGVKPPGLLSDARVVLVEDAPSLLIGGLAGGAGAVAARRFRCGVVDPRPFAVGAVARALEAAPHLAGPLPALGRTPAELADLGASVKATPGDVVLWASNADPTTVLGESPRPVVRAFGELMEVAGPSLTDILAPLWEGGGRGAVARGE